MVFCNDFYRFTLSSIALFTRGHEAVKDGKVIEVYRDTHLPMDLLEADHKVCCYMFHRQCPCLYPGAWADQNS